jgi:transposase
MRRFVEGTDRSQATLFPERLEDWICEDNPVRAVDVFVDELDLAELGFGGLDPEATGRPSYHPSVLLKLYIYGYLNRVQSSRRLEREAGRNIEVMWLTGRLVSACLLPFGAPGDVPPRHINRTISQCLLRPSLRSP